jgi:ADP-ribose pyrophosphatase YjhB (NUDIX family)
MYYLLPGGGQIAGAKLKETLIRECIEETGFEVEVNDLVFVRECLMDKDIHRVEFIFKCEIVSESIISQMDKNQIGIEWLEIVNLPQEPLFPRELRTKITELNKDIQKQIYIGEIE